MTNPLATFSLWAGLFGGLALFLFGMDVMTQALKNAAGDYMKDLLGTLTRNRLVGAATGAFVTAVIQSSSVTTVILVGFITAGVMSMSQSVSVIIGANIGTTITAQILAFNVTALALPMIALGFLLSLLAKPGNWKQVGFAVLGLGLVFYGMSIMSEALSPLGDYAPFIRFMVSMEAPLLGVLVGTLFTAIVQSSAATTGILIVLATQGLIGLDSAITIALGANIGTCVTAALASIGKPREAVRAALVHTLFNVLGVILWIAFIPELAELARWLSPAYAQLAGAERLAAETPRQIANAHTLFNLFNALLFIGFTPQLARLAERLIPDRPIQPEKALLPKFLDDDLLATPAIALEAARQEIRRLGKPVSKMVHNIMPAAISGSRAELEAVAAIDRVVDARHIAIIEFLGKISLTRLSSRQSRELMQLAEIANELEYLGDRIATGMVTSAKKRIDEKVTVSPQTAEALNQYHRTVSATLDDALEAVIMQDRELAAAVRKRKKGVGQMARDIAAHGLGRLTADEPNRLKTYAREMEIMELLDGVFTIARRIAQTQI
jgi:phosphate:Na+ symporter